MAADRADSATGATPAAGPMLREFPDRGHLFEALTAEISALLRAAILERGHAALALSGGTTPGPLLDQLSATDLPWDRVRVTLTDERWVDTSSPQSNEHLVRSRLLRDHARDALLIGLKTSHLDPALAVEACNGRLAAIGFPLDAVVLGMGLDGHVASLFPGAVDAAIALDPRSPVRCLAVRPPADAVAASNARMSLSLAALLDTRRLLLLATGEPKRALIARILAGHAPETALPVGAVFTQRIVRPELWWAP